MVRSSIFRYALMSLVIASVIASFACRCGGEEEDLYIGELPSKEAGLLASIPKLADLLGRCPETKVFRVWWVGPGDYPGGQDRHALLYDRTHKMIGYEDDFLSGISGRPYAAVDNDVRSVAEKQGTLTDFTLYERRPR